MKSKIITFVVVLAGLGLGLNAKAATLSLSPATGTYSINETFTVSLNLDTLGVAIDGVDILYLNYNTSLLEVQDSDSGTAGVQIGSGSVLSQVTINTVDTSTGKITFSKVSGGGTTYTGSGVLATINFKALASGTANLSFDFTSGSTIDTNIASAGTDLLTAVTGASYGIGGATPSTPPASTGGAGSGGAGSSGDSNTSNNQNANQNNNTSTIALKLINVNGTYYLIQNNIRRGVTNPGMLFSYGFEFKDAKEATESEKVLSEGQLLLPGDGSLVKSPVDPTVYLIARGKKYGFASAEIFAGLGHKFSSVLTVTAPELDLMSQGEILTDSNVRHLPGTHINDNGTVYWLGESSKHAYPSLEVFNSWNADGDFSQVVPANSADLGIPEGALIEPRILQ